MSNDIKTWPATKTIIPVSVEEFKKRHPAMLGAIAKAVRKELETSHTNGHESADIQPGTGKGCVMGETWLPACILLTAGLFSLSLALLRILVDLDPIGWILSLGEVSRVRESGCSRGCANNHNPSLECSNRHLVRVGKCRLVSGIG